MLTLRRSPDLERRLIHLTRAILESGKPNPERKGVRGWARLPYSILRRHFGGGSTPGLATTVGAMRVLAKRITPLRKRLTP